MLSTGEREREREKEDDEIVVLIQLGMSIPPAGTRNPFWPLSIRFLLLPTSYMYTHTVRLFGPTAGLWLVGIGLSVAGIQWKHLTLAFLYYLHAAAAGLREFVYAMELEAILFLVFRFVVREVIKVWRNEGKGEFGQRSSRALLCASPGRSFIRIIAAKAEPPNFCFLFFLFLFLFISFPFASRSPPLAYSLVNSRRRGYYMSGQK